MSLAPYLYRPMTPPETAGSQHGHYRNISNSSCYTNSTSPESILTGITTPSRSPVIRQHGPTLLPKIRSQDSSLDPSSAGRMKSSHRRALSATQNPPAGGSRRPPMYRSATEPVECSTLMSPVSNVSRASSMAPSPGLAHASLQRTLKSHSRSASVSSIDNTVLNRFGYPTYRQMPVYVSQTIETPNIYTPSFANTFQSMSMLEPPMINLEGTFDMPIDLEAISRPSSMTPPPTVYDSSITNSLIDYLTQPTQPVNLVRHINYQTGRGLSNHFWWDVRNVRSWDSFSLQTMSAIPDLMTLLNFQHDINSFPFPGSNSTVTPASESDLANMITKIHFPKVNTATQLSLGANAISLYAAPTSDRVGAPTFLANYPNDGDRTLSGLPRGRVVGIVKAFDKWNTGMRREGPARKVEYLKGLAHLQKCMRDHSCRYGFIMTEIELICVRAGCDEKGQPYFGHLELSEAIATQTAVQAGSDADGVPMTVTLALYFLLMLAKATPLPGQPSSFMDVGGPGAMTRQRTWHGMDISEDQRGKEGRDKWIPEPQVGEKREARTTRGWIWPSDPWHRREGGGRKRN